MTNTPGMIILKTEKVLPGNGQLPYPKQSEKIDRLSLDNCGGQSFLFCLLSIYWNHFKVTSTVSETPVTISVAKAKVSSSVIGHPPFAVRLREDHRFSKKFLSRRCA